jgi:hypothetical protein
VKGFSSSDARGTNDCGGAEQLIFAVLITSPSFETEKGLRVGMSEADVTRLHPGASSEQAGGQPLDDDFYPTVDDIYGLVTTADVTGFHVSTLSALVRDGRVVGLQVQTLLGD